jgi:Flp pilus assembly protein TadG
MQLKILKAISLKNTKLHSFIKRWSENQDGVTVIEFAVIAPVFFALLLMTIESGIVFAAQEMFDAAVYNASRSIVTGSIQSKIGTASPEALKKQFRAQVCLGMSPMISAATCDGGLLLDMKRFSTSVPPNSLGLPLDGSNKLDATKMACANFGGAGEYMLVRGYYQYPVYVSYLGGGAGTTNTGTRLLVGTAAFKVEPHPNGSTAMDTNTGKPAYNTCP